MRTKGVYFKAECNQAEIRDPNTNRVITALTPTELSKEIRKKLVGTFGLREVQRIRHEMRIIEVDTFGGFRL